MNTTHADTENDSFSDHVRAVLKGRDGKIAALLNYRTIMMHKIERMQRDPNLARNAPTADELNRMYASFLREAADILGDDDFRLVFDQSPQEQMNIIDPGMYEQSVAIAR